MLGTWCDTGDLTWLTGGAVHDCTRVTDFSAYCQLTRTAILYGRR